MLLCLHLSRRRRLRKVYEPRRGFEMCTDSAARDEEGLVRLSCIDENLPTARLRHRTDELRRRSTDGDLRALHRRDGPGGSHGKEGLGPIPEVRSAGATAGHSGFRADPG